MPRFFYHTLLTLQCSALLLQAAPDWKTVQGLLDTSCYDCHKTNKAKGGVDLKRLSADPKVEPEFALWEKVQEVIAKGEMPPEDETQLSPEEKNLLTGWIKHELDVVATRNAGDPGPVTLRRLTNFEYDNTVRDLTGVDFGLGKEFMPDGGGGEGFSNTGDVLFTNPQQLDKYLAAARKLADHAAITPGSGIDFQAQRVGMRGHEQLRDQAETALYVWYQKMSGPHLPKDTDDLREADYMLACWKWKHKDLTGAQSLEQLAAELKLSPAFLQNWWTMLHNDKIVSRYLDLTRKPWHELPGPDAANPKAVPGAVTKSLAAIQEQRKSWYFKGNGSVQRQQQDSDGIRPFTFGVQTNGSRQVHIIVGDVGDGNAGDYVQLSRIRLFKEKRQIDYVALMKKQRDTDKKSLKDLEAGKAPAGPEKLDAAALKKRIAEAEGALALFGKNPLGKPIADNVLAVQAPRVITLPLPEKIWQVTATGKLDFSAPDCDEATVQWKMMPTNPIDPKQIMPGVLTIWKRQTKKASETMSDFGRMKGVFPDIYDRRLEEVANNFRRYGPGPGVYYFNNDQLAALLPANEKENFRQLLEDWRYCGPKTLKKDQQVAYDQLVQQHLQNFASRAWRRPLSGEEKQQIVNLYGASRTAEMSPESAARETVIRVLVSPHFLFKTELTPPPVVAATDGSAPPESAVSAWELASRLSYFLWSSMPDWQLRKAAEDGSLLKPEVRAAQVKRMLRDWRAKALAKEFMGQWLDFDGFQKHSNVDDKKFPEFTDALRNDFYAETVAFCLHIIQEDRPVREIVGADYSFINERLAKHYGVSGVTGGQLRKVSLTAQHRGGLLGQGSLLTKMSRSHRTSPVLRGNWLLQSVLGTPVPPPPSDVPELKEHGAKPATVREMLEQHRAQKACMGCHDRIDPLGFALENFDPIGRFRDKEESGLPLDATGEVKGSPKFTGFEGLKGYLISRENQVTNQFSRKLLGFALGRSVMPSDKLLLKSMSDQMAAQEGRFSAAVLAVVNSRQFLNRRN